MPQLSDVVDKEPQSQEVQPNRITLGSDLDDPEYHQLSDFFDVDHTDRRNPQTSEKMNYLLEWAWEVSGRESREDAMLQLQGLKRFLGITEKGPGLVGKMYKWARLDTSRRSITKQMKLLHENDIISES